MTLKNSLKTAITGLRVNKMRSALTMLGIIIGVASIIAVLSIGRGAQNLILDQVSGLGAKTIIIRPGREPKGPSDFSQLLSDSLKERDVKALEKKSNVPGIADLTPVLTTAESVNSQGETYGATILGASDLLSKILEIWPKKGRFFNNEEIKQRASLAVIGSEVKNELFGNSEALGKKIKIKSRNFKVIGVLPQKGQLSMFNIDDTVIIPYTTCQKYLLNINYYHLILVQAKSEEAVPEVEKDIKLTLRELHKIENTSKDDFRILTQTEIAQRVKTVTGILTWLLMVVAAISLVVGGIGVMNIMLVSVTERTREIGLRKAVGATNKDILMQFLLESVILTLFGGIGGIIFGVLLSFGATFSLSKIVSLGWNFTFPITGALLGLGVSACIGLVFGLYPASQASKKSPIEALRYE
ncbi:ABC transporter permease [bacterium]|nr:ABC transporter permease [bacterium]